MVQLIAVAALGAVAYVGYNAFKKHMSELEEADRRAKAEARHVPNLEKDPVSGKYRPKD